MHIARPLTLPLAARKAAALLLSLLVVVGLTTVLTVGTATTASAAAPCDKYAKAKQPFVAAQTALRQGVQGLDSDGDGYACERLAAVTDTPNDDPDCFRRGFAWHIKDCSGRSLYRDVYWMTGTPLAMRGAGLDVFGPAIENSAEAKNTFQFFWDQAGNPASLGCLRGYLLEFVDHQNDAKQMNAGAEELFGHGPSFLQRNPALTAVAVIIHAYFAAGSQALKVAEQILLSHQAAVQMAASGLC